jgi:2-polyprenyl-6-methoxyphenol hydroxylase-like FAD-dependent oxidoreductase
VVSLIDQKDFDVVVVGAGVAGSAAALALAKNGLNVALIGADSSKFPETAETLPGVANPWLSHLGIWSDFQLLGPLPLTSSKHRWRGQEFIKSSVFSPYGPDWIIPKNAFVQLLRKHAQSCGATLLSGQCQAVQFRHASLESSEFAVNFKNQEGRITARALIDASGRGASTARQLGGVLTQTSRQIAAVWHMNVPAGKKTEAWMHVADNDEGWTYAATSVLGGYTVSFYATPSTSEKNRANFISWAGDQERIRDALKSMEAHFGIDDLMRFASPKGPVYCSASSSSVWPVASHHWVAVGDAACSLDPLASTGTLQALRSACKGAYALSLALQGNPEGLRTYATMTKRFTENYQREKERIYEQAE